MGYETATGRVVIGGYKVPNGYTTKFTVQSISAHLNFQTIATWKMNILAPGTEDIIADSSQSIGGAISRTVSTPSPAYTNITGIGYVQGSSNTSDVSYQTNDQSISVLEGIKSQETPDLPCSASGSTSIFFSLSNYLASVVPSCVSIDSVTGVLNIAAPEVDSDTEYDFYITSVVSGISTPIQKLIKLTILNCLPSNCYKCKSTNSTV